MLSGSACRVCQEAGVPLGSAGGLLRRGCSRGRRVGAGGSDVELRTASSWASVQPPCPELPAGSSTVPENTTGGVEASLGPRTHRQVMSRCRSPAVGSRVDMGTRWTETTPSVVALPSPWQPADGADLDILAGDGRVGHGRLRAGDSILSQGLGAHRGGVTQGGGLPCVLGAGAATAEPVASRKLDPRPGKRLLVRLTVADGWKKYSRDLVEQGPPSSRRPPEPTGWRARQLHGERLSRPTPTR